MFLSLDNLDTKNKTLLEYIFNSRSFGMILVGRVKLIEQKIAKENNSFLLDNQTNYSLITIDKPNHILGFEENDSSLYDYS